MAATQSFCEPTERSWKFFKVNLELWKTSNWETNPALRMLELQRLRSHDQVVTTQAKSKERTEKRQASVRREGDDRVYPVVAWAVWEETGRRRCDGEVTGCWRYGPYLVHWVSVAPAGARVAASDWSRGGEVDIFCLS